MPGYRLHKHTRSMAFWQDVSLNQSMPHQSSPEVPLGVMWDEMRSNTAGLTVEYSMQYTDTKGG